MNIITKARRYAEKFGGVSAASAKLGMPRSTLCGWLSKSATKRQKTPSKKPTEKGEWMQSLLHDSAHYFVDGIPACSNGPKAAKIVPGVVWMPHDGCVRRCTRCLGALIKSTKI